MSWNQIARRIRVPLGFVFAAVYLWLARPTFRSMAASSLVVAMGLLIRALASGHVRKNEQLATGGPYSYTRNPLYLGSIVIALGFAAAARSWWIAGILVIFFLAIYLPVIRSEESWLRAHFPEYADYEKQVPRLLPRFNVKSEASGTFSWSLYLQHREYNALTGAIAVFGMLLLRLYLSRR